MNSIYYIILAKPAISRKTTSHYGKSFLDKAEGWILFANPFHQAASGMYNEKVPRKTAVNKTNYLRSVTDIVCKRGNWTIEGLEGIVGDC